MKEKFKFFDLRMFGDGDGTASVGDTNGASSESIPAIETKTKKGELSDVIYGKHDDATTETKATLGAANQDNDPVVDKQKAFENLIKGEYKDQYTKATQEIINKRFKETKNLEESNKKFIQLGEMLSQKYGTNNDIDSILNAVENDDAIWETLADEEGMTVEQFKNFRKLEKQNKELQERESERKRQEQAKATLDQWYKEAEETKKAFPNFDLETEQKNPQFLSLLKAGLSVTDAYKSVHIDDIVTNAMTETAKLQEKRITDNIRAKGNRPIENGTKSQGAFLVKDDVSKLTKADREEIAKRVSRGERIVF